VTFDVDIIFLFFASLLATYSLQRLLPMKLYDWEKFKFSPINWNVIWRYSVGCFANLCVAISFAFSWYWLKYLNVHYKLDSFLVTVGVVSIAISSSSIVLTSHRIVAGIAIAFKHTLFPVADFGANYGGEDFQKFLNSKPIPHLLGALFFLLSQMLFGLVVRAALERFGQ
jgi:hypothetical protein